MKFIAFDIGSTVAWACSGEKCSYTFRGTRAEKLAEFAACLPYTLRNTGAEAVVFERPFCRGLPATRLLWGMAAIIEVAAEDAGLPCVDIVPAQIKKWAAGNHLATKAQMIAAARRLGCQSDNEHEADAWCLLKYAEANVTRTTDAIKGKAA